MKCYPVLLLQLVTAAQTKDQVNDANQTHDEDAEYDANENIEIYTKNDGGLCFLGRCLHRSVRRWTRLLAGLTIAESVATFIAVVAAVVHIIAGQVFGDAKGVLTS